MMIWTLLTIAGLLAAFGLMKFFAVRSSAQTDSSNIAPKAAEEIPTAQHYRDDTVGNDASARPWDNSGIVPLQAAANSETVGTNWNQTKISTLSFRPDQLPDRLPAAFDLAACLETSKARFMQLHQAWEQADSATLRKLLSPAIWADVEPALKTGQLRDWGKATAQVQHLTARILSAEAMPDAEAMARVKIEYTGSLLNNTSQQHQAIEEMWDVLYQVEPAVWQIANLKGSAH